jgi:microcystin-dependent protein
MSIFLSEPTYASSQNNQDVNIRLNALEDEMLTTYKNTASIPATAIANFTISDTEFQYLNGATSNIQGQINQIKETITANPGSNTGPISEAEYLTLDGSLTNTTLQAQINAINSTIGNINLTIGSGAITANEFLTLDNINTTLTIQAQLNSLSARISALQPTSTSSSVPVGSILFYGADDIPSGYLRCDGSQISYETYAALYDKIRFIYTPENGSRESGKFYLPDLRGLFVRGSGRSGLHLTNNNPFNIQWVEGTSVGGYQGDSNKKHTHEYEQPDDTTKAQGTNSSIGDVTVLRSASSGGSATLETTNSGNDETRPHNMSLWYIIKY